MNRFIPRPPEPTRYVPTWAATTVSHSPGNESGLRGRWRDTGQIIPSGNIEHRFRVAAASQSYIKMGREIPLWTPVIGLWLLEM